MSNMRAKFVIRSVEKFSGCDVIKFSAVGRSGAYPADGSDENNTFAKFTPSAELSMSVTNPDLLGAFEPGQAFYVDFILAELPK